MNLWIRNQDKTQLIETNDLFISYNISRHPIKIEILTINNQGKEIILGEYETKERALEILDKIQQKIINLQLVQLETKGKARHDAYTKSYLQCVYNMPKE